MLYINDLLEHEIKIIETRFKFKSKYSTDVILGKYQDLKKLIRTDARNLKNMNVTHKEIADFLKNAINDPKYRIIKHEHYWNQIDLFENKETEYNTSYVIHGKWEKIEYFPKILIYYIEQYQFFGGSNGRRIEPNSIINMMKKI